MKLHHSLFQLRDTPDRAVRKPNSSQSVRPSESGIFQGNTWFFRWDEKREIIWHFNFVYNITWR